MPRIVLTLFGLQMVAVLAFFCFALPSDQGAYLFMTRFSGVLAIVCAVGFHALPDSWKSSATAGVLFAILLHPEISMMSGAGIAAGLAVLCLVLGTMGLAIISDGTLCVRAWVSDLLALLSANGPFAFWYFSPYRMEVPQVLSVSIAVFIIAALLAPAQQGVRQAADRTAA